MRIKNLILLTIATLCCTTALAGTTAAVVEKHYNDSIREGQTYLFYDYFVTEQGTYNNLLHGVGGHDDLLVYLHLNVLPACTDIEVSYTDSIVLGESYLLANKIITPTEVGTLHEQTIIARASGCDSTINLTLKVLEPCSDITVAYTDSIVLGETYLFIDQFITPTEVGTVNASAIIPRVAGCDSTINLTLKVLEPCSDITVAYTDSIVLGETYLFIDQFITPTEVGTVNASAIIPRVAGCDSTINLTLKVLPDCEDVTVAYTDSIYLGETYLFVDQMITPTVAGTTNHQAITPRHGCSCDSIINLTLIAMKVPVADTIYDSIKANLCYQEEYKTRLQVVYPTQDTTISDTIRNARVEETATTIITYDSIYVYELKVWPAMTTTTQTDSLRADYGSFTWNLGSRDSIITDFVTGVNHREYMYQNIRGCDSAKFVLDVTVWPAMTTTTQTDSLCADYGSFTWNLGSRDSIITDFTIDAVNHREYMYKNILGGDSAKFVLDVTVWPATKYPEALKDTIDEDKFPYMWNVYEGRQLAINAGGPHFDTVRNSLPQACDSIIYELDLAVRTVVTRYATPVDTNVCKGTDYVGRLTTHTINGLTEWQDSLRIWDNDLLLAIDSIYKYKVDTLPTKIPDSEISQIKAYCDYPVDYSYAWLNVAEFVNPSFIFAEVTDTIWEVETKNGWNPAATTIITSEDEYVRVRVTVVTECETTYSTSEPYEVKMATADDKEELTIPAAQKYGSRIIMIDRKYTADTLGWTIPEADVTWYQVVDEPDDRGYDSDPATWNDRKVKESMYYYTLTDGAPLVGQFYATITGAMKPGMTCGVELRTPVLVCNQSTATAPVLAPTMVGPNDPMTLSGLDATKTYSVRVIGMDGSFVNTFTVNANEAVELKAASVQGMYIVNVQAANENVSLKYIVK